ncbi:MAG: ribonuclease HI [Lachnospiraceae bacterium]|nr:ribonuclease HI [Lachnospiraceae bacterium]
MYVKLFSDGACSGNGQDGPSRGGYGTILQAFKDEKMIAEREYSQGFLNTTNNRMELLGVITGLENITKPSDIEIISDSKYVIDAFNQNWVGNWVKNGWKNSQKKPVKNIDLWERLIKLLEPHNVKFTWVKGHNDHPENERCDTLAVNAYNSDNLIEDTGYEA